MRRHWALSFIHHLRRYISPEQARQIINILPQYLVKVGVFVNENAAEVKRIIEYCGLDIIQLHGDESPEYCRQFPAAQVIKAVELKNEDDLSHALGYNVAAILVDSRHAGLYGGTGKKANWELAQYVKNKKLLILSGGLNETNVKKALERVAPQALDINSGVEISPGKKDHIKMARIFDIMCKVNSEMDDTALIFTKREI